MSEQLKLLPSEPPSEPPDTPRSAMPNGEYVTRGEFAALQADVAQIKEAVLTPKGKGIAALVPTAVEKRTAGVAILMLLADMLIRAVEQRYGIKVLP